MCHPLVGPDEALRIPDAEALEQSIDYLLSLIKSRQLGSHRYAALADALTIHAKTLILGQD